jgi:hypothetical protein
MRKKPEKVKSNESFREKVALTLARGAVSLVLIIALGAFGRAFYLAVALGQDHPISDAATQLLTALGSALVGGAVGYISGTYRK